MASRKRAVQSGTYDASVRSCSRVRCTPGQARGHAVGRSADRVTLRKHVAQAVSDSQPGRRGPWDFQRPAAQHHAGRVGRQATGPTAKLPLAERVAWRLSPNRIYVVATKG